MKKTAIGLLVAALASIDGTAYAGSQVTATKAALATPSPTATQVGLNVLKSGGNAIDASVAVAFALAVTRPQNGPLGGGGYLTYFDAATGAVWTLDFREAAPAAATAQLLADPHKVRAGAIASGVPGTVAGLDAMHKRFGSKPWRELLQPAITLAGEGVRVDQDLATKLAAARTERGIDALPSTGFLYFTGGKNPAAGDRIAQPDLSATLTRLAEAGPRDFYDGEISAKLVEAARAAGSVLSERDLREYAPIWRAPLRFQFADNEIYTVGPPSGGGMQLGIALSILGGFDLTATGLGTPATIHLIAEAQRRAAIDTARYVGDPSTTRVPYRDLLSDERSAGWRKSIRPERVTGTTALSESGSPVALNEHATQFVVVDAAGNVASIVTTLGDPMGGGLVLPSLGFFLNDSLRDFTDPALTSMSNAVAGGKRPTDGMTSVLVLRHGHPYLAFGASGDGGTAATSLEFLLDVLVFDQPLTEAIAEARFDQRNQPDQIEYEQPYTTQDTINALNAMGHAVAARDSIGEVEAVMFEAGRIVAVADSRGSGAAGGLN